MFLSKPGWADLNSANLTPASGRQDHTTSPYAATSLVRSLGNRSRTEARPAIPSRAKRCRVHRTPPRVRDDHDTPLWWGGMRTVLDLISVRWQQIFFGKSEKKDSTAPSTNRPTGKSPRRGESPFRGPDAAQRPFGGAPQSRNPQQSERHDGPQARPDMKASSVPLRAGLLFFIKGADTSSSRTRHSGMVRQDQTRNLEIPGSRGACHRAALCADPLARPGMTAIVVG